MAKRTQIREAGFTIFEVLIAAAIGGTLTIVIATMLKFTSRTSNVIIEKTKAATGELLGQMALTYDIDRSGISFNFLNAVTDDGGNPFYDYLPDFTCTSNCSRTLTLTKGVGSFIAGINPGGLAPPTPISPNAGFYLQTPPGPANLAGQGTITFDAPSLVATIGGVDPNNADANRRMLKVGRLLRFYSAFYQRPLTANLTPDMGQAPRMLSILTAVGGTAAAPTLSLASIDVNGDAIDDVVGPPVRPDTGTAVTSIDLFFRFLPPIGGTGAFALVVPLDLVRYRLRARLFKGKCSAELIRETFNGANFGGAGNERFIAGPVTRVTFFRPNISVPSIQPTIVIDKDYKDYRDLMGIERIPPVTTCN